MNLKNATTFLVAIGLLLPTHQALASWNTPHKDGYINEKNQYIVTMPRQANIPQDILEKSYSRRVVFVNKADQRMRLISGGKVYHEFYVTTARGGHSTISCNCRVGGKFRNITLRGISKSYAIPVKYWIETDRYSYLFGVHDATWRNNFGTRRFLEDGSLGCINTHPSDVPTVYNFVSVGDWFIIR